MRPDQYQQKVHYGNQGEWSQIRVKLSHKSDKRHKFRELPEMKTVFILSLLRFMHIFTPRSVKTGS